MKSKTIIIYVFHWINVLYLSDFEKIDPSTIYPEDFVVKRSYDGWTLLEFLNFAVSAVFSPSNVGT